MFLIYLSLFNISFSESEGAVPDLVEAAQAEGPDAGQVHGGQGRRGSGTSRHQVQGTRVC